MSSHAPNQLLPLLRRLDRFTRLEDGDKAAIAAMPFELVEVPANQILVPEGQKLGFSHIILSGFACRQKIEVGGGRQIFSFLMAGDLVDIQSLVLEQTDHQVRTITPVRVARVPKSTLKSLLSSNPGVAEALWRDTLVEASIFREWILNVGRRGAKARIAHMLCEFAKRLAVAGLGDEDRFELPMTQEDIADATGLTPVHVNRMLQALAADGVIERDNRHVIVGDGERLRRIGGFDVSYLHLAA